MAVRSNSDIESVRRVLEAFCKPIGQKVSLIVNYDGFRLDHAVADQYFEMAARLQSQYYKSVSRFTSCAFMRAKLRTAFCEATSVSHVCETQADAMAFVTEQHEAVGDGVLRFPRRRHQPF
jgi:propionate CoA-transferase